MGKDALMIVLQNLSLVVVMMGILFIGKVAFALKLHFFHKESLHHGLVGDDNVALAITFGSFLGALTVSVLLGLASSGDYFLDVGLQIILGAISIIALFITGLVNDRFIQRKVRNMDEILKRNKKAVALVEGASYLGTALILSASWSSGNFWWSLAWFAIGQVLLVIVTLGYCKMTGYDDLDEIDVKDNLACAFPLAGFLLATALVIRGAINGPVTKFSADVQDALIYLAVGTIVIFVIRWLTIKLFEPHGEKAGTCTERNISVGVIESIVYVSAAAAFNIFM